MGLLLSVLVAAVGVIELISFYNHVVDNLRGASFERGDISEVTSYYHRLLDNRLPSEKDSKCVLNHSRSTSPVPKNITIGQISTENPRRRSLSPYPSFELTAPRNSICPELLDNPTISVTEVDEEAYSDTSNSRSVSPPTRIESTSFNNSLYWTKKPYLVPRSRSRSRSRSPSSRSRHSRSSSRSASPIICKQLQDAVDTDSSIQRSKSESNYLDVGYNGNGIKRSSSNGELVDGNYWRKSPSPFMKLLLEDHSLEDDAKDASKTENLELPNISNCSSAELDDAASSSSLETFKTLEEAAKKLTTATPTTEGRKSPEPFWVK